MTDTFDPTKKKRRRKKKETVEKPKDLYTYEEMLNMIYTDDEKNVSTTKLIIQPPIIYRDGAKHTIFENIEIICNRFNRTVNHLKSFIESELSISISIMNDGRSVRMQKLWQPRQIETIIKNYAKIYVRCPSCMTYDTNISKVGKLSFINCHFCGASRVIDSFVLDDMIK